MKGWFRVFATFALLASLVIPVSADQWQDTVKKAQNAVFYMETTEGSCTAFGINVAQKYVMSAAHCFDKELMLVDRVPATLVSIDTKKDLLVLHVKDLDPQKGALALAANDPAIRQDVMSVGYGFGLERPFFKTAHVSDTAVMIPEGNIGGPFIGVDASYTAGQSGGPVVDSHGEVVSIVQRGDGGTLGLGVGANIIRDRMGRFFAQK